MPRNIRLVALKSVVEWADSPARPQPESDAGWSRQLTPDLVAR